MIASLVKNRDVSAEDQLQSPIPLYFYISPTLKQIALKGHMSGRANTAGHSSLTNGAVITQLNSQLVVCKHTLMHC